MKLVKSQLDIAEDRRREVAVLRRRRLSHRQIARALEQAGRVNPKTGAAWSYETVRADLEHLTKVARSESLKETSEHKAECLAEYQELLRVHWQEKNYEGVRKVWADIRELMGTDSPQVIVYEQVQNQLDAALGRLEREFADNPALLGRIFDTLANDSGADSSKTRSFN